MKKFYLIFFLIVFFVQAYAQETNKAEDGVLDITSLELQHSKVILIEGKWEFYWNKLYSPKDFLDKESLNKPEFVTVPGNWNSIKGKETQHPAHGFGTYRLLIKTKYQDDMFLKVYGVSTAFKIWANGVLLGEVGKVATTKGEYVPELLPKTFKIDFNRNSDDKFQYIEVIIQASNYEHTNSGIWEEIELGSFNATTKKNTFEFIITSIIIGIFLIISLYHFILYFYHRTVISTLFFGILTFFMAVRASTVDERIILYLFPNLDFYLLIRIEYLSVYANILFIGLFFYNLFKDEIHKTIIKIIVAFGIVFSVIIVFAPVNLFSSLRDVFNLYVLLGGFYLVFRLIKAVLNKRNGAILASVGLFAMLGTSVFDVLIAILSWSIPYTASYGLLFYLISQSVMISKRFSDTFNENKLLSTELNYKNQNLEKIVTERTKEISSQSEKITQQYDKILKSEIQLKEKVNELVAMDEELRQNNEELHSLNESIEVQKKIIEEKELRLSTIISNQGEGFATIDNKGNFLFANPASSEVFDLPVKELLTKNLSDFFNSESLKRVMEEGKKRKIHEKSRE